MRARDKAGITESPRMQIHRCHSVFYAPTIRDVPRSLAFLVLPLYSDPALCTAVIVQTSPLPSLPPTPPLSSPSHMFPFLLLRLLLPPSPSLRLRRSLFLLPRSSTRDDLSFRKDARIALSRAAFNSRR